MVEGGSCIFTQIFVAPGRVKITKSHPSYNEEIVAPLKCQNFKYKLWPSPGSNNIFHYKEYLNKMFKKLDNGTRQG